MGKTLQKEATTVAVTDIQRFGEKLIIPEGMTLRAAKDLIERREEYEKEVTQFRQEYDVLPYDGAHALAEVLINKFGWAPATSTPSFFGDIPPKLINIEVAPGKFKVVPWGRFSLPNVRGHIETSVGMKEGRYVFAISAQILRMNEETVRSLFEEVRVYLLDGSIYKGKAIQMRFRDDEGKPLEMPQPKFIDTSKINPKGLIYSQEVMDSVETNLFVPISRAQDCIANGIPVKRGVLLAGTYGTGKTLAATVASRLATDAGITYVYAKRADEMADAIEFGKQYQSPACVVFVEDIDRSVNGERSVEMDDILNILDGIDTKNANIITVVTTNDLDSINPAMLRPGRLDAVIHVTPPDAHAVENLIRFYGGAAISADTDLTEAGRELAGNIPAVIAEVVKRAKLSQLRLQEPGTTVQQISSEALTEAAKTMRAQVTLLRERSEAKEAPITIDGLFREMVKNVVSNDGTIELTKNKVGKIAESMGIDA